MVDYEHLLNEFKEWQKTGKAAAMLERLANGGANYINATSYAESVGAKWAEIIRDNFSTTESAEDFAAWCAKALNKSYNESAYYTNIVTKQLNKAAGIGMKAAYPKIDETRISGLLNMAAEDDANISNIFSDYNVSSLARSAVTDTAKLNARLQNEAGLASYIERDPGGGCCEWCNKMAGRYKYGEQPEDFFRVHQECSCKIIFKPAKRSWEKISYTKDGNGKLRRVVSGV